MAFINPAFSRVVSSSVGTGFIGTYVRLNLPDFDTGTCSYIGSSSLRRWLQCSNEPDNVLAATEFDVGSPTFDVTGNVAGEYYLLNTSTGDVIGEPFAIYDSVSLTCITTLTSSAQYLSNQYWQGQLAGWDNVLVQVLEANPEYWNLQSGVGWNPDRPYFYRVQFSGLADTSVPPEWPGDSVMVRLPI